MTGSTLAGQRHAPCRMWPAGCSSPMPALHTRFSAWVGKRFGSPVVNSQPETFFFSSRSISHRPSCLDNNSSLPPSRSFPCLFLCLDAQNPAPSPVVSPLCCPFSCACVYLSVYISLALCFDSVKYNVHKYNCIGQ